MHGIRKRIHKRDAPQPSWKRLHRINGSAGEKQQRVQDPERRPRHERIFHPHHHQKHHAVERRSGRQDHRQQSEHGQGIENRSHARNQRPNHGDDHPGPHLRGRAPRTGFVLSSIGVVTVLLCTWFYSSTTLWPGTAVIAPVVATGAIIAGGSLRGSDNFGRFVKFAPIQWMGNLSYSLYLVHWPIIAIATQYSISPLPLHSEIELVALSIVLSVFLYYTFENPIRKSTWLANRRLVTFTFGAILIGCSLAVIYWHL